MGSGKSAVGRRLARLLDWEFVDSDREVERDAGRKITGIFATEGEAGFRRREAAAVTRLLSRDRIVLATGGGWACRPGRLDTLDAGTRSVWLKVSLSEALARTARSSTRRPLLEVDDPRAEARRLMEAREPFYRKADLAVETDARTPGDVAREIVRHLDRGGATRRP